MLITAFFTLAGVPDKTLAPLISGWRVSDGTQVVTNQAMVSVVGASIQDVFYKYNYSEPDSALYFFIVDGGVALPSFERYKGGEGNSVLADIDAALISLGTIESKIDIVQVDLDNPTQYMADVSALAVETSVEIHVTNALNSYDPPTRGEATSDKDEIITQVNANETKIDILQTDLTFLKDVEGGKWELINYQLIFYKADNTTPVATFNCFDEVGSPAMSNITKCERV